MAVLRRAGHEVVFATEHGARPAADPRLLTGVIFGQLGADPEPRAFYAELEKAPEFARAEGVGGLDPRGVRRAAPRPAGTRPACGSTSAAAAARQEQRRPVLADSNRPVAAICHGVLVLARTPRSRSPAAASSPAPHHLPAEVHGARGVLADRVEARPLLPHLSGLRRGRGAGRARAIRTRSSSAGRSPCPPAAPRPTTGPPSWCATATTSPPAGRATRTSSPAGSATCLSPVLYPERTGLPALLHVPLPHPPVHSCPTPPFTPAPPPRSLPPHPPHSLPPQDLVHSCPRTPEIAGRIGPAGRIRAPGGYADAPPGARSSRLIPDLPPRTPAHPR